MNSIQPVLAQIVIYPIKSLDGVVVDRAQISAGGALEFDRRWGIVRDSPDSTVPGSNRFINGKQTAKIHQLRSQFDLAKQTVHLQSTDDSTIHTFSLNHELKSIAQWLSDFFGFRVSLIENAVNGFPDDLNAYGPTIVSQSTLETICTWFPDLDLAEVRRRFRTNLELSGVPAFWEDRLFGAPDEVVNFQIGDVGFEGINPCQRCPVPTRDTRTGIVTPNFQKTFTQQRQLHFPDGVNRSRFNHFYRLAVNTQIPIIQAGKFLNTGDELSGFSD